MTPHGRTSPRCRHGRRHRGRQHAQPDVTCATAGVETRPDVNVVTRYAYDRAGNRTGVWINGTQTVSHTFNAAHQVVGWTYDAAGNLLGDGVNQYTYDALHRLTRANDTISQDTGDGPLVAQTTQGLTTRYSQDLAAPLPQVLARGDKTPSWSQLNAYRSDIEVTVRARAL